MALQDYLMPSEDFKFRARRPVKVGSSKYALYLTNRQLILYAKRGLRGRDDVLSWDLTKIDHLKFKEGGLIFKSGRLSVEARQAATHIVGSPRDLRSAYLQARSASNVVDHRP